MYILPRSNLSFFCLSFSSELWRDTGYLHYLEDVLVTHYAREGGGGGRGCIIHHKYAFK
jgi:hypothetical protein